ncbi:thioredoxin domain-containing protein 5-like [Lytechinus variegatus]|uniref:thioredoxin domain-containing protein 5-like n=1 Tax=Lytechinus variegatus TaxID=7654 RepID=UPI001BB2934F|nr:thioredoxin domain-containing protein 5-like [Lytechinus variegatus]
MKYFSIIVLVTIGLNLVHGEEEGSSSERNYDTSTFKEEIGKKDHFVKFFAPWCGHCRKLAPVWTQLSEKYNTAEDSIVTIAKVDCTVETSLCSDHGVTGYPTLKLYKKDKEPLKYKGKRDLATLEKYIEDELNPQEPGVPQPPEAKNGLYELTVATFKDHVSKGHHFIKFYAPWCGHCKRLAPTWEQLAQGFQHSDFVKIAKVDCTAHRSVCEQYGIKGYPTLKFFKDGEAVDSYNGGRDHVALKEYVSKMTKTPNQERTAPLPGSEDAIKPVPVKEQPPEEQRAVESKVAVLSTNNFLTQTAKGTSFVKFYAPWCPHCEKLSPIWDQLAEKFDSRKDVTIAKVDCTKETEKPLCQKHDIRGYPTLLLFKDGEFVEKHSGTRTLDALENYVRTKLPKEEL